MKIAFLLSCFCTIESREKLMIIFIKMKFCFCDAVLKHKDHRVLVGSGRWERYARWEGRDLSAGGAGAADRAVAQHPS